MSIKQILTESKTIAIIGASSKQHRTSYTIAGYLIEAGYHIIPINPNCDSVHGLKSYNSVFDLPPDIKVDMIDIFRNRKHTLEMVQEIVEWSAGKSFKPVIWTQLNVSTPEARQLAEENGFRYIENRCIMVDHRRHAV